MYINYKLANGTTALVEVTEEVADFIINDDRLTANANRRERYNCPYHIDAMKFDGMEYAYHETPEKILIRKEDAEHMMPLKNASTPPKNAMTSCKVERSLSVLKWMCWNALCLKSLLCRNCP